MNPDAARSLTNASADFEEPGAQSFDLYRAPRLRQLQKTKQIDQIVGEGMQQQAEGVGQKAVAAQAIGAETVLEFFDAILAFTAVVDVARIGQLSETNRSAWRRINLKLLYGVACGFDCNCLARASSPTRPAAPGGILVMNPG